MHEKSNRRSRVTDVGKLVNEVIASDVQAKVKFDQEVSIADIGNTLTGELSGVGIVECQKSYRLVQVLRTL